MSFPLNRCQIGGRVLVAALGALLLPVGVGSQGIFDFQNTVPIYDVDGATPLAGPGFLAQVYAAAPGNSLQPVTSAIPFLTGGDAGYYSGGVAAVPGVPPGGTASVQVVAWRASDGATFAAANHRGGQVGESSVIEVRELISPGPPEPPLPQLWGMQSFSLYVVVPEPSVFALGLLGGAVLVLGRRRGRFR